MHLIFARQLNIEREAIRDIMVTLFDNETILKGYTREKEITALNEGRKEGMKEGQTIEKIETVKKMLHEALPIDLIVRLSGLSVAEINTIKAQMAN